MKSIMIKSAEFKKGMRYQNVTTGIIWEYVGDGYVKCLKEPNIEHSYAKIGTIHNLGDMASDNSLSWVIVDHVSAKEIRDLCLK